MSSIWHSTVGGGEVAKSYKSPSSPARCEEPQAAQPG